MPAQDLPSTQRAYTLKLVPEAATQQALWSHHAAINAGAAAYGDFLLTLRGGLDHRLAEHVDDAARRDRRIILALSWLAVESPCSASENRRPSDPVRNLKPILEKRGLAPAEIQSWLDDCTPSLSARIRDDAVWVDRSSVFDSLSKPQGVDVRAAAWSLLSGFLGAKDYFTLASSEAESDQDAGDDKADYSQQARGWLSKNWGSGEKADKSEIGRKLLLCLDLIPDHLGKGSELIPELSRSLSCAADSDAILGSFGWRGRPSAGKMALEFLLKADSIKPEILAEKKEKIRTEVQELLNSGDARSAWAEILRTCLLETATFDFKIGEGRDLIGEHSVMFDHALRRVSGMHSWIRLAEAERRQFRSDADKMTAISAELRHLLDRFCIERGASSGALDEYRIRKRAAAGWDKVILAWQRSVDTEEARIEAARELQDDPEITKFGDIHLFEKLAAEDMKPLWQSGPQALNDYVAAQDAQDKEKRFKVPAYRHPDPLRHPVFCDFGNSRCGVSYSALKRNAPSMEALKAKVEMLEREFARAKPEKKSALDVKLAAARREWAWFADWRRVDLDLWDGRAVNTLHLHWKSKKLQDDLALSATAAEDSETPVAVVRADRLGRAKAEGKPVRPMLVFDQKDWSARLQCDRSEFDALACHVEVHGWDAKALAWRERLHWFISYSAKLAKPPADPRYFSSNDKGIYLTKAYSDLNKNRGDKVKFILPQTEGLRILSVDLGHRIGASCAVWELQSQETLEHLCGKIGIEAPKANWLRFSAKIPGAGGKSKTIIFRRTSERMWARLDRQFAIRLDGEEDVRKASPAEFKLARQILPVGSEPKKAVDELRGQLLASVRHQLRSHGDLARIAYLLRGEQVLEPGGRTRKPTAEDRQKMDRDALSLFLGLASSTGEDAAYAALWTQHFGEVPACSEGRRSQAWQELISSHADKLANPLLRVHLIETFSRLWSQDDALWPKSILRPLRDWILPAGIDTRDKRNSIRFVGGLSLSRIADIKSLWQVQKAYAMRPEPTDPRKNVPAEGDHSHDGFGQSILDAMESMRGQRVKQLASRMVEAALGLGAEPDDSGSKSLSRASQARHAACHAIVIESLENYRPDEMRTRRENRGLLDWSSAKIKKFLQEGCELHGLYLREVSPSYTSRQCSRTGAPGLRCTDLTMKEFRHSPFWRRQVERALEKRRKGQGDARERLLAAVDCQSEWPEAKSLRLPQQGAELFVAAGDSTDAAKGLQADFNAAANIGLRALLDPDFSGSWWYLPAKPDGSLEPARFKGGKIFESLGRLPLPEVQIEETPTSGGKRRKAKAEGESGKLTNYWRSPSCNSLEESRWLSTKPYWAIVQKRVCDRLRRDLGLPADE